MIWGYVWWWEWLAGAAIALLAELGHEVMENTEWMIKLYRANSGTSALYKGDSAQNIVGDLLSCVFGWYISALCVHYQVWWIVLVWTVTSEVCLVIYMRDNGVLVCYQLIVHSKTIQNWQAEMIPDEGKPSIKLDVETPLTRADE